MLKKRLMELLWRVQQSQTIISIIFWPLTITGIFYPFIRDKTNNYYFGPDAVFWGMIITFFIIVMVILIIGLLFDKLRFWKEQNIVNVERNPYTSSKLNAKEVFWIRLWTLNIKTNPNLSAESRKELELFESWVNMCLKDDPILNKEVDHMKEKITPAPCEKMG